MTTPATPSNPTPAGDDRNLVAADATTAVTFEDKLQLFWKRNRNAVLVLCVLIVLGIAAKEGWKYMQGRKDADVQQAYQAATTPEQIKAFAVAHPEHPLGALAQLRLADDAYKAGNYADAATGYDKAIAGLKDIPPRALIGRALAKVQSGKAAEGQAELKKIADDTTQLKAVRAEAVYHLTGLAVEGGNAVDAQKLVEQLQQIDIASPFTQRAMALRATLHEEKAATASNGGQDGKASAVQKDKSSPSVKVKIPGK